MNRHGIINQSSNASKDANITQAVLFGIGNVVSPDRKKHPAPVLRRRGLAFLGALAIVVPGGAALANRVADERASNIPTTEQSYNPKADVREVIPQAGAFDLASQVDPSHDPRIGVEHMQEQLGHTPEPGDMVVVPKNMPK